MCVVPGCCCCRCFSIYFCWMLISVQRLAFLFFFLHHTLLLCYSNVFLFSFGIRFFFFFFRRNTETVIRVGSGGKYIYSTHIYHIWWIDLHSDYPSLRAKTLCQLTSMLPVQYCRPSTIPDHGPKGFTTEFLTLREFFDTSLENFDSMEEYIHKVTVLMDDLEGKEIKLSEYTQVVMSWVLYHL